ncbi:MAG TPA: BlaI/MecI/CopY family transcriptional regulator [Isosphaeraceae bacterium]|nr:BlaI/MecI/CopY family transcriptional regulator [Isosphaeraceae bacterium]
MARPRSSQPTDGEMEILKVLWAVGPAELGQIRAQLQKQRPVATTTIATMLKVMLGKKLVKRSDGKRGYVWSARASRTRTASELVRKVLDHVFDGSAGRLVAHLLEETELDRRDRDEIRKLLEAFDAREVGSPGETPP